MLLDRYVLSGVRGKRRWAIALLVSLLASGVGAGSSFAQHLDQADAQADAQLVSQAQTNQTRSDQPRRLSANPSTANFQLLYVNADTGSNQASGTETQPLRTITRALEVALPNTVIVLAPGRYNSASGETFPIQLKPGVTIQGAPGSGDRAAIIEGGGDFTSPMRSRQNAAIIAADRSGIAQVAISNPEGYGVWIESASPTILESAFINNQQTGIYIATGSPRVQGSYFSGNRVAGLIVFGQSTAIIHQNTFDNTGDAIRVLDEATPDIAANQIVNNEAGLVMIGSAQPTLRDNRLSGNRQDEIVEMAASTRQPVSAAVAAPVAEPTTELAASPQRVSASSVFGLPVIEPGNQPLAEPEIESVAEPVVTPAAESAAEPLLTTTPDESPREILPGAPGAALAALTAGAGSEPKAGRDSASPGSMLLNLRRRRQEEQNTTQEASPSSMPSDRPAISTPNVPINNNRLAVPGSSIPVGSGSSSTVFSPPSGGAGSPPAPPSRAQALGLYYRVFVEASDPFVQDEIRSVVPDAFRTRFEGRAMMQVGAFPTEEEAEDRRRLLEENNYDALVEYIR